MGALRLLLVAALVAVATAIYPDDHWSYSTQLNADNFESFIQGNLDAGKTTFVRWIASAGWYVLFLPNMTMTRDEMD